VVANSLNSSDGALHLSLSDATTGNVYLQGNSIVGNTGLGISVWRGPNQILNNRIVANGAGGICAQ